MWHAKNVYPIPVIGHGLTPADLCKGGGILDLGMIGTSNGFVVTERFVVVQKFPNSDWQRINSMDNQDKIDNLRMDAHFELSGLIDDSSFARDAIVALYGTYDDSTHINREGEIGADIDDAIK
jgi:hypothetical protein